MFIAFCFMLYREVGKSACLSISASHQAAKHAIRTSGGGCEAGLLGNDQKKHEKQCAAKFQNGSHHLPMIPQEKRAVPWLMVDGSLCGKKTSNLENKFIKNIPEGCQVNPTELPLNHQFQPLNFDILQRNLTMADRDL
ncbi:uncharacterized [Tachysurus ichikawai]